MTTTLSERVRQLDCELVCFPRLTLATYAAAARAIRDTPKKYVSVWYAFDAAEAELLAALGKESA
jgi:hypothetical protein